MKMNRLVAVGTVGAAGLAMLAITAPASAESNSIKITNVKYNGSACPADEASIRARVTGNTIHISGRPFDVVAGSMDGGSGGPFRPKDYKNCTISLSVENKGLSYAVVGAAASGEVSLPEGADARLIGRFNLAGTNGGEFGYEADGPREGRFITRDRVGYPDWSNCEESRSLNVSVAGAVNHGSADRGEASWMTVGSGNTLMILKIDTKSCDD